MVTVEVGVLAVVTTVNVTLLPGCAGLDENDVPTEVSLVVATKLIGNEKPPIGVAVTVKLVALPAVIL